jgi:hypothetical protein
MCAAALVVARVGIDSTILPGSVASVFACAKYLSLHLLAVVVDEIRPAARQACDRESATATSRKHVIFGRRRET